MASPEVVDVFGLAQAMQLEIELIEDPVEAAFRGQESVATLNMVHDPRLVTDGFLVIRAFSAHVFPVRTFQPGPYRSMYYDEPIIATGRSIGRFGFIQNLGVPLLQTLFLGLRNPRVVESWNIQQQNGLLEADEISGKLVIPVLSVESLETAA